LLKGIFGKKYVIAPENLAEMVYNWVVSSGEGKDKASKKTGEFLMLIQNPERKLYYAERFQNYDVAMDVSDLFFVLHFIYLFSLKDYC
jgi:hypothetical protein